MTAIMNIKVLDGRPERNLPFPILNLFLCFSELNIGATVEISIDVEECEGVTSIEHVIANISYSFHRRGDVKLTLISPSRTPSELLSFRNNDATDQGLDLMIDTTFVDYVF